MRRGEREFRRGGDSIVLLVLVLVIVIVMVIVYKPYV